MQTVTAAATSSSVTTEMIRVRGLTFTYPKATQPAVRGMDFSVSRGEIFGFLGPSGAGKSTTEHRDRVGRRKGRDQLREAVSDEWW